MTISTLLDIETYAIENVADFLDKPTAPANYKNPVTIEAWVEQAWARLVAKAALKPDLGRIVSMAWMQDDRDIEPRVKLCKDERTEKLVLEEFFDDLTDGDHFKRVVTFNGHRFDLPFVMRRAMALDIEFPMLRVDRNSPHLDLYRLLSLDDVIDGYTLDFYLRRYNIDCGVEDDTTGADIAELVRTEQWDKVAHHNRADVLKLHALASWMHVIDARAVEETEKPF